jgi:hypothetical protein
MWVWNGVHSALVRINEELLERKVTAHEKLYSDSTRHKEVERGGKHRLRAKERTKLRRIY